MGDFGADTLRDSIEANWNLTGDLSKTATDTMSHPVKFFAHPQIKGLHEAIKAVEVQKVNTTENENVREHPRFEEVNDVFIITCRRRVERVKEATYDEAEKQIEDMCEEVVQIIKTVYQPSSGTGTFFVADRRWSIRDTLDRQQPELVRVLTLTLTQIKSDNSKVFRGFGGVLTFDLSASSNMDSAPAGDYAYTEAHRVRIREGYSVVEYLTKDSGAFGARVPKLAAGRFRGFFNADIFADGADIGTTAEKLDRIYKLQANGEHIEAVFLHAVTDTQGTPQTLTETSYVKVTSMEKIAEDEQLVGFHVEGRLIKPSTYAVA